MRTALLLAVASVLALPACNAQAGDFSYRYVEGGYLNGRVEGVDGFLGDIKPDGYYLGGSLAVGDRVHVFGRYGKGSDSKTYPVPYSYHFRTGQTTLMDVDLDYDVSLTELGVGLHHAVSDNVDLITEAAAMNMRLKVKAETLGVRDQVNLNTAGGRMTAGVRFGMGPHLEGLAKVGYMTTGGDLDNDGFVGSVGLQAKFSKTWGAVAQYDHMDDLEALTLGVRASF